MPWSNQSGGNGGGPRGTGGGPQGPWGSGPKGGGNRPPDLEDMIRRSQDRIRGFIPGGSFGGGKGLALIVAGALVIWLMTGWYTVKPDEVGVNKIFGRFVGLSEEGLRYNLPYPIGSIERPKITTVRTVEIGTRTSDVARRAGQRVADSDSLMLTGDENIVDIDFTLQWQVDPAKIRDFVFNLENPSGTVRVVAESAMREVIGRRNIQSILTTDRAAVEAEVKQLTQDTLNSYGAGVEILRVNLQKVDPPAQVIDAFRDVQAARQDQDTARNEAEVYASKVVPEARGEASKIIQGAEAYRERLIAEAKGAASRFDQVYVSYKTAPDVIRERMYLDTMEHVLGGADKVILDENAGPGVVPYLPLGDLSRGAAGSAARNAAQPGASR